VDFFLDFFTFMVLCLTLLFLVGGVASYILDVILFEHTRRQVWDTFHHPWWDKDYRVRPRHLNCLQCEVEVEKVGGELEAHSGLE
jgi:hypothetical protein